MLHVPEKSWGGGRAISNNAFNRFMVEPEATPGAHYRPITTQPSGAALAAFSARGVTAISLHPGCILDSSHRP